MAKASVESAAKRWGQLATAAGTAIGLEFEGGGELETARQFVRMGAEAVKNATAAPPGMDPRTAARNAVIQADKVHAPALLKKTGAAAPSAAPTGSRGRSGRWIRRGSKIVLLGV